MVIDILKETGALLEGHFLLSSGKHSDGYVQCAKLLMHPEKAEKVVSVIVEKIKDLDFDIVVGPAMGGVIVSYELARQVGKASIFVEREDGKMSLRRGFKIEEGTRVLVTEDVVTTGKSAYEAIDVIEEHGGIVVAIASIVNRSSGDIRYPLYSAVDINLNTYSRKECPMCKKGSKPVKPGSRKIGE